MPRILLNYAVILAYSCANFFLSDSLSIVCTRWVLIRAFYWRFVLVDLRSWVKNCCLCVKLLDIDNLYNNGNLFIAIARTKSLRPLNFIFEDGVRYFGNIAGICAWDFAIWKASFASSIVALDLPYVRQIGNPIAQLSALLQEPFHTFFTVFAFTYWFFHLKMEVIHRFLPLFQYKLSLFCWFGSLSGLFEP